MSDIIDYSWVLVIVMLIAYFAVIYWGDECIKFLDWVVGNIEM